jgi:hypothetical protein
MVNNKKSIRDPKNRFRRKILQYASMTDEFNVHQIHDWYWTNYPKETPSKNKLSGYLAKLPFLKRLGYKKSGAGKKNMVYKLRNDYALDREIQAE